MALKTLHWSADQLGILAQHQVGCRRHRCTADSIADVIATLVDAKSSGDVVLLLLDEESAFDDLKHAVIEAALDQLRISWCFRRCVTAFLPEGPSAFMLKGGPASPGTSQLESHRARTEHYFLQHVARRTSSFFFDLPDTRFPAHCSVCADDVALWAKGLRKFNAVIRRLLQAALVILPPGVLCQSTVSQFCAGERRRRRLANRARGDFLLCV